MIKITLYSKDGCHLCEIVKNDLASLKKIHPHLTFQLHEIDITQDRELFKKYCLTIPVLEIGAKTLEAPIEKHQLIHALNL
ncbi:MAG: glutaredoxin family protein [Chloroflexi bacterium]|nr:MAG: glutaredoxin family protein [Chloroflexota bacterium]